MRLTRLMVAAWIATSGIRIQYLEAQDQGRQARAMELKGDGAEARTQLQRAANAAPNDPLALEAYAEQAEILAESGVEILNIITMFDLEEAVIALRAAKTHTSLPVIVKLTPNSWPAGKHIWVANEQYRTGYAHLAGFAVAGRGGGAAARLVEALAPCAADRRRFVCELRRFVESEHQDTGAIVADRNAMSRCGKPSVDLVGCRRSAHGRMERVECADRRASARRQRG